MPETTDFDAFYAFLHEQTLRYDEYDPEKKMCIPAPRTQGCTPQEIAHVEEHIGQALPLAYRKYLEHMGRYNNVLPKREFTCYPDFLKTFDIYNEEVPGFEKVFVYYDHDAYDLRFFDLTEASEDPQDYSYDPDLGRIYTIHTSFTESLDIYLFVDAEWRWKSGRLPPGVEPQAFYPKTLEICHGTPERTIIDVSNYDD